MYTRLYTHRTLQGCWIAQDEHGLCFVTNQTCTAITSPAPLRAPQILDFMRPITPEAERVLLAGLNAATA